MSYKEELETAFEYVSSNQPVDFKAAIFDIFSLNLFYCLDLCS